LVVPLFGIDGFAIAVGVKPAVLRVVDSRQEHDTTRADVHGLPTALQLPERSVLADLVMAGALLAA
jgi:hypothetical protein